MEPPMIPVVAVQVEATATAPPDLRAMVDACFQIQDRDLMLRSLDVVLGANILDGAISIFETSGTGTPKICKIQGPSRAFTFVKGHGPNQFYLCVLRDDYCEYCSCRSFMERCRKNEPFCKHLLALKLYPLLGVPDSAAVRVETLSDEASFRNVVLQRLFPQQQQSDQQRNGATTT
jgi:predicted nucleic acid-binding Zn finger protein